MSCDTVRCGHCGREFPEMDAQRVGRGTEEKILCPDHYEPGGGRTRAERRERAPQRCRRKGRRERLKA